MTAKQAPSRTGSRPAAGVLPTATDGALRLRYLREVGELLWPPPARVEVGRSAASRDGLLGEFVLVPDARRPRLLVPAGERRAAAAAVRRYAEPGSTKLRIVLNLLSAALASGLGGLLMRDRVLIRGADDGAGDGAGDRAGDRARATGGPAGTIETYLRSALGPDLVLSLHIGPARANRKPVLQLLDRAGATTGFAKLGVNDLTRRLVRAERDSLREVGGAGLRHTTVPGVLHHGRWNDLEVLVQSPLPVWERRAAATPERLAATMREIAEVGGVSDGTLGDSAYWARLGERLAGLHDDGGAESSAGTGDGGADRDGADGGGSGSGQGGGSGSGQGGSVRALRAAHASIGDRAGGTQLRFGAWHGDLTPWNMATLRETILVWDWERFARGVPLGFDALHYAFQGAVVRQRREPRAAVADCVDRAPELLAPFGVDGRAARLTAMLYLIDIATRYLEDGQAEAGARLGALGQWLLPVLVAQVEGL